jgi:hypothetical protein
LNKENIMHIKLLYNERERQTKRLTSVSVSTQTDPEYHESSDENNFQDAVEGSPDYSFITDKTSKNSLRILEHPVPKNRHHDEYRMCHPNNSRTRIQRSTFRELKDALQHWQPDDVPWTGSVWELPITGDLVSKCLLPSEDQASIRPIFIFAQNHELAPSSRYCIKIALFDTQDQKFILRTAHQSAESPTGLRLDCSTILAFEPFWVKLKEILNSI